MKKHLLFTLSLLVLIACKNDNELKYLNKNLSVAERVPPKTINMDLRSKKRVILRMMFMTALSDS